MCIFSRLQRPERPDRVVSGAKTPSEVSGRGSFLASSGCRWRACSCVPPVPASVRTWCVYASVPKPPSADPAAGHWLVRHQASCCRCGDCPGSPDDREAGRLRRAATEQGSLREALADRGARGKGLPEGRRRRYRDPRKVPDGEMVGIHCWWSVSRTGAHNTLHLPLTAGSAPHKSLLVCPGPSLDSEFFVDT